MAKLNPPYIENVLPAFTINGTVTVPFNINRTITNEISEKASIIIKHAISNKEIFKSKEGSVDFTNKIMNFTLPENLDLKSGQYYKIQVAFINKNNEEGYFSVVGIAKCIYRPILSINGMEKSNENSTAIINAAYKYIGACQLNEPSEKIYSYCFTLKDKVTDNIIFTTGECIHDSSKDVSSTESIDMCYVPTVLDFNNTYDMYYSITTINGFKDSTKISVKPSDTVNISLGNNILVAEPDPINGTIIVKIQKKNIKKDFTPLTYNFILLRASNKDNFQSWERISGFTEDLTEKFFEFNNALLVGDAQILWEDVTIEHGVAYKYALQAYNSFGLLSNKIESNLKIVETDNSLVYDEQGNMQYTSVPVQVDFEDMFLSDGDRQLCIRFNPKVSSFKNTVLESKMDTIGSQYPFFFRNGTVKYKEFPISGLISLLMDPNDKFKVGLYNISKDIGTGLLNGTKTDLTHENIKNEREFKLEVLDWLTNGQPKIFRSPTEGNYLVRLMNTSLSPTDTLGRMLHTFSCTAYEIDTYNFETLYKYGFINCDVPNYKLASFIGEVEIKLSDYINNTESPKIILPGAYKATIHENYPYGAIYNLNFIDSTSNPADGIQIGQSGIYEIPISEENYLTQISWKNWNELKKRYAEDLRKRYTDMDPNKKYDYSFKVVYAYYDMVNLTNFHFIENIEYVPTVACHIGELNFKDPMNLGNWETDENGELLLPKPSSFATWGVKEIGNLYQIRIKRRPLVPLYFKNNKYYFNKACTEEFSQTSEKFLLQALYVLEKNENNESFYQDFFNFDSYDKKQKKIKPKTLQFNDDTFMYTFNEKTFSLNLHNLIGDLHNIDAIYESTTFELDTTLLVNTTLDTLILGNGLMIEIIYLAKNIQYNFGDKVSENEKTNLQTLLNVVTEEKEAWQNYFNKNTSTATKAEYLFYKQKYEDAYNNYVKAIMEIVYKLTKNEAVTIE